MAASVRTTPLVVAIAGLAFAILFGYGLVRGPVDSLFVAHHTADGLPAAWVLVAVVVTLVVAIYGRAAAHLRLTTLHVAATATSASCLLLLLPFADSSVGSFALYVWKDVHVVVLIEILWSLANVAISFRTARWTYGLFCACGSLGGISGNLLASELAVRVGSHTLLFTPLAALAAAAVLGFWAARLVGERRPAPAARRSASLDVLLRSRLLILMLVLVSLVQVAITLIDFGFNAAAEAAYPATDPRTEAVSRVYAVIDGASLALQVSTGVILRLLGVGATLMAIPIVLGGCLGAVLAAPAFLSIAVTKIASKSLDYSLFRAAKEILYLPLGYSEKTQGKAVIDIFGYRVAKGYTAVILAGLSVTSIGAGIWLVAGGAVALWLLVTAILLRHRAATQPPS